MRSHKPPCLPELLDNSMQEEKYCIGCGKIIPDAPKQAGKEIFCMHCGQKNPLESVAPDSESSNICPAGHGELRDWGGRLRCWTCGYEVPSIFLLVGGQQNGPYSEADIMEYLNNGQVALDTLSWEEGASEWLPVNEILRSTHQPADASLPEAKQNALIKKHPFALCFLLIVFVAGGWLALTDLYHWAFSPDKKEPSAITKAQETSIATKAQETSIAPKATSPFFNPNNESHAEIERAIRSTLKKPTGEISQEDLDKIKEFSLSNFGEKRVIFTDIEPLKYLRNCEKLQIRHAKFLDLEPLRPMKNLKVLDIILSKESILHDITALEDLKLLEEINLSKNPIKDISPIMNHKYVKRLTLFWTLIPESQVEKFKFNRRYGHVACWTLHHYSFLELFVDD